MKFVGMGIFYSERHLGLCLGKNDAEHGPTQRWISEFNPQFLALKEIALGALVKLSDIFCSLLCWIPSNTRVRCEVKKGLLVCARA